MDAVHNIPQLLHDWGHCDEKMLRNYLAVYDRKWGRQGPRLVTIFDDTLSRGEGWVGRLSDREDSDGRPLAGRHEAGEMRDV